jgi:hypothetical protein
MKNYSGDREVFCGDYGPTNGAECITGFVDCFGLFFDKTL